MAIIGFWKPYRDGLFSCYKYFYIPTPLSRVIKESNRIGQSEKQTTLLAKQVLYKGFNEEIFLFYSINKSDVHLGILNLSQ